MKRQIALVAALGLLAVLMPTTQAEDQYVLEGSTGGAAWVYSGNQMFAYMMEEGVSIDYTLHVRATPEGRQVTYADLHIDHTSGEAECKGIDRTVEGQIDDLFVAPLGLKGFEYIPCEQLFVGLEPVESSAEGDRCRLTGNLAGWNQDRSHWKHIKLTGELDC